MADQRDLGVENSIDVLDSHTIGHFVQPSRTSVGQNIPILSLREKLSNCQRILVLIPNLEMAQGAQLPQRIWQLASPGRVKVLYVMLGQDYETEMSARRHLSLLAAITRDKRVHVETMIVHTSNWANAIKSLAEPGDVILAHSEQTAKKGLFGSEPLCDQLERCLTVPVYPLSGYVQMDPDTTFQPLRLFLSVGLLGLILAGFLALDDQVIAQLKGTLQQVILILMLLIEIGAIWVWNNWAG